MTTRSIPVSLSDKATLSLDPKDVANLYSSRSFAALDLDITAHIRRACASGLVLDRERMHAGFRGAVRHGMAKDDSDLPKQRHSMFVPDKQGMNGAKHMREVGLMDMLDAYIALDRTSEPVMMLLIAHEYGRPREEVTPDSARVTILASRAIWRDPHLLGTFRHVEQVFRKDVGAPLQNDRTAINHGNLVSPTKPSTSTLNTTPPTSPIRTTNGRVAGRVAGSVPSNRMARTGTSEDRQWSMPANSASFTFPDPLAATSPNSSVPASQQEWTDLGSMVSGLSISSPTTSQVSALSGTSRLTTSSQPSLLSSHLETYMRKLDERTRVVVAYVLMTAKPEEWIARLLSEGVDSEDAALVKVLGEMERGTTVSVVSTPSTPHRPRH